MKKYLLAINNILHSLQSIHRSNLKQYISTLKLLKKIFYRLSIKKQTINTFLLLVSLVILALLYRNLTKNSNRNPSISINKQISQTKKIQLQNNRGRQSDEALSQYGQEDMRYKKFSEFETEEHLGSDEFETKRDKIFFQMIRSYGRRDIVGEESMEEEQEQYICEYEEEEKSEKDDEVKG